MSKEIVTIGCKLPAGIILEVGLQTVKRLANGHDAVEIKKLPNYARIELKGWHAHTAEVRKTGIQVPAGVNMRPYLNRGVSKSAWDQWKAEHAASWLLKNEILFEVKAGDELSAALRVSEGDKTPAVLAPLNKDKPIPGITKADFIAEKKE